MHRILRGRELMETKDIQLVVAYIVENDEDVFELSYNSIKDHADDIIVINGNQGSLEDEALNDYLDGGRTNIIARNGLEVFHPYEHDYKGANGKQRNIYLQILKDKFPNAWCLVLDSDEVVDNPESIKPWIQTLEEQRFDACSPTMRHFIGDLAHEDASLPIHTCPLRLFKVTPKLYYDEVEHPVLQGAERYCVGSTYQGATAQFTLWHLAYAREVVRIHNKYINHLKKSNIPGHTPQFLERWYHSHIFGQYPTKTVDYTELPRTLKEQLHINDDLLYFMHRLQPELKHWEDAKTWVEYFKPKTALEVGCGVGHRARALYNLGVDAYGFDISKWAIDNCPYPEMKNRLSWGTVLDDISGEFNDYEYDLIICYDVLEHINEEDLDKAIENIKAWTKKHVLISVPVLGDPNLSNDPTHKIFWSKEQWITKFAEHGLATIPTPNNFLYQNQIIILEKQQ